MAEHLADRIKNQIEAVQKRPGMYLGSTGPKGLHRMVFVMVDNAIDEAMAGYCSEIDVDILPDNIVSVRDNGRGRSAGRFIGEKVVDSGYMVPDGRHDHPSLVVNALSEWLEVESAREGKVQYQRFERGNAVDGPTVIGDADDSGITVRFKADPEVFYETTEYAFETLKKRLQEQAFLNAGLCIRLNDRRDEEHIIEEEYDYKGGISSFVEHINKTERYQAIHPDVIRIRAFSGDSIAEVALQYNDSDSENILSFANNVYTEDGGTHETAFKEGLTCIFNDYAHRHDLLEPDATLEDEDVFEGLTAVVSVKLKDAQFEGMGTDKLGNVSMGRLITTLLNNKLVSYLEENPTVAKTILEKVINAARVREAV